MQTKASLNRKIYLLPQLLVLPTVFFLLETTEYGWNVLLVIAAVCSAFLLLFSTMMVLYYRLKDNSLHYNALMSNIRGGVQVTTCSENPDEALLIYANDGYAEVTGYTEKEVKSLLNGHYQQLIYDKDRMRVAREIYRRCRAGEAYSAEYRIVKRSGEIVWVLDRGRRITAESGRWEIHSVLTDITELKHQQEKLRISEERFRLGFSSSESAIFEFDVNKRCFADAINTNRLIGKSCRQLNNELSGVENVSESGLVATVARSLFFEEDIDKCVDEIERALDEGEADFVARFSLDEGFIWCKIHLLTLRDTDELPMRVLGFVANIDAFKRQADIFKARSEKDALTGFYNKAATVTLINEALGEKYQTPHVLFVLDIDNFKSINDTLGHIAGDAVLAEAAERIRSIFRSDDILGRIGGDEFVVLLTGVMNRDHVVRKAQDVIDAFRLMSINSGGAFNVSVSIGIDQPPLLPTGYDEIFERADRALYHAKSSGKNGFFFYDEMEERPQEQIGTGYSFSYRR